MARICTKLYDIYNNGHFVMRCNSAVGRELVGCSLGTFYDLANSGRISNGGCEVLIFDPEEFAKSWEEVCRPLRRKHPKVEKDPNSIWRN